MFIQKLLSSQIRNKTSLLKTFDKSIDLLLFVSIGGFIGSFILFLMHQKSKFFLYENTLMWTQASYNLLIM